MGAHPRWDRGTSNYHLDIRPLHGILPPGSVDVSLVWGLKANDAMPLLGKAAVAWHFQVPASTTTGVSREGWKLRREQVFCCLDFGRRVFHVLNVGVN